MVRAHFFFLINHKHLQLKIFHLIGSLNLIVCCIAVSDSQQNFNVLRGLAIQLQKIVNQENQKCWGKPLGSEILWKGHVETIERIQQMATQIKIKEVYFRIFSSPQHEIPSERSIFFVCFNNK